MIKTPTFRSFLTVLITATIFTLLGSTSVLGVMPPHPELEDSLRAAGEWDRITEKLTNARSYGMWMQGTGLIGRQDKDGNDMALSSATPDTFRVIVLLADFDDHPASGGIVHGTKQDFEQLLFSYDDYDNHYSMAEFYRDNSYGKFIMLGDVAGWYRMPESYDYYVNGNNGFGPYPRSTSKIVEEALLMADAELDYSDYDNDNNGVCDGLFMVHAGPGAEQTGSDHDIWSHFSGLQNWLTLDGISIRTYSTEPEENTSTGLVTMGVFAHEYGHFLGLPDLYDTDYSSSGIGYWSVMAGGSWGSNGARPVFFDAWCKYQLGWIDPINVTSNMQDVEFPSSYHNDVVYRLWENGNPGNEFFLIENRRKVEYDLNVPGSGLAILHVDQSQWGNSDDWHRLVNVEQADGDYDLESDVNNGDGGDVWSTLTSTNFDDLTTPDSRKYGGAQTRTAVWNISDPDSVMTANLDINYSRARFDLMTVDFDDNLGGDGDGAAEPGETIRLTFSVENAWLTATNVTATAGAYNDDITFGTSVVNIGTVSGSGGSGNNNSLPIEFTIPADFEPCIDSFFVELTTDNPLDYIRFGLELHMGGAEILVVDDDAGAGWETSITSLLLARGKPYDLHDKMASGSPTGSQLNDYQVVIWLTGDERLNILSAADVSAMETYLDNGGNLFLTGQSIVKELDTDDVTFLNDYLRADYDSDLFWPAHTGVAATPLGDGAKMRYQNSNNQTDPQAMTPVNGGVSNFTLTPGLTSVITYQGSYNLVLFSFGFEAISNDHAISGFSTQAEVLDDIMTFFGNGSAATNPVVENLSITGEVSLDNVIGHSPEFTWSVSDTSGGSIVEYQMRVGTGDKCYNIDNMWEPATVVGSGTSATYGGLSLGDGASYVFSVRVNNGINWSEWFSLDFHMNSAPQPANLITPVGDQQVTTATPLLKTINFPDADGDVPDYDFEVYSDAGLTSLVTSGTDVAEQSAATGWTVDVTLTEDQQYFWRTSADDGFEVSDYSAVESFWVNAANSAPAAFKLVAPADGGMVIGSNPTMVWETAPDSDPGDFVLYTLQVSLDSTFGTSTEYDHIDDTTLFLPLSLDLNSEYFWRVLAEDLNADSTWSTETYSFLTEVTTCCVNRGDINDDGGVEPDISDLVYLVAFMFSGGPEPPCMDAADVNGDSSATPDIADLVYLVAYMFSGGPAPVPCF